MHKPTVHSIGYDFFISVVASPHQREHRPDHTCLSADQGKERGQAQTIGQGEKECANISIETKCGGKSSVTLPPNFITNAKEQRPGRVHQDLLEMCIGEACFVGCARRIEDI